MQYVCQRPAALSRSDGDIQVQTSRVRMHVESVWIPSNHSINWEGYHLPKLHNPIPMVKLSTTIIGSLALGSEAAMLKDCLLYTSPSPRD